jgi:hypothetical protein
VERANFHAATRDAKFANRRRAEERTDRGGEYNDGVAKMSMKRESAASSQVERPTFHAATQTQGLRIGRGFRNARIIGAKNTAMVLPR